MGNIEAIIVDGVRYDKVKAKTEFVCAECDLRKASESYPYCGLAVKCNAIASNNECWKRKE